MEGMWDIKRVLESQGNMDNKVEVQSNSESEFESNSESRITLPSNWRTGRVRPLIWVIYKCMEI
jgi:hypothetical protein